jgi:hypothetical protein
MINQKEVCFMAKVKAQQNTVGFLAFLIGVLIAVIAGLFYAAGVLDITAQGTVALVLVILGLVVGLLNMMDKEVTTFLLAVVALEIAGASAAGIALIPLIGVPLAAIVNYIAVFVFPAAVIVALKAIWDLATA